MNTTAHALPWIPSFVPSNIQHPTSTPIANFHHHPHHETSYQFGELIKKYGWAMFILGAAFGVPLAVNCKDLAYPTSESIQLFNSGDEKVPVLARVSV